MNKYEINDQEQALLCNIKEAKVLQGNSLCYQILSSN